MTSARLIAIVAAALVGLTLVVLPFSFVRTETVDQAIPLTRDEQEIGRVVRSYLMRNPEILREMAAALQAKESQLASVQQADALRQHADAVFRAPRQVELGNPNGDVVLVEFFDYNCGYCRRALADLNALLESDPKLKIVLKELPVLGEESREAARVAVAVQHVAPDRYLDFHRTLLGAGGQANGARALAAAKAAGVDAGRLNAELASPAIDETLDASLALAQQLGIDGTPSWVIADAVVPGAIGTAALKTLIANARNCGKASCS